MNELVDLFLEKGSKASIHMSVTLSVYSLPRRQHVNSITKVDHTEKRDKILSFGNPVPLGR